MNLPVTQFRIRMSSPRPIRQVQFDAAGFARRDFPRQVEVHGVLLPEVLKSGFQSVSRVGRQALSPRVIRNFA
jgi:hypothetical protein